MLDTVHLVKEQVADSAPGPMRRALQLRVALLRCRKVARLFQGGMELERGERWIIIARESPAFC